MKGGKWALGLAVLLAVKGTGVLPRGRGVEERKLVTALAGGGLALLAAPPLRRALKR